MGLRPSASKAARLCMWALLIALSAGAFLQLALPVRPLPPSPRQAAALGEEEKRETKAARSLVRGGPPRARVEVWGKSPRRGGTPLDAHMRPARGTRD